MRLSIIAALGQNHVIGTDDGLPWHLPSDLKRFRFLTRGKPVIMGRKTLEHIGHPLPDRSNIVLSRRPGFGAEGVFVVGSPEEALRIGRREAERLGVDELMVIGGGEVYRAFLPFADRLYLTVVAGEFEGTATFPLEQIADYPFEVGEKVMWPADNKNPFGYTFWTLNRCIATKSTATRRALDELLEVA